MERKKMNKLIILICSLTFSLLGEDITLCIQGWNETQAGNHAKAIELFKEGIKKGDLTQASLARTYRNLGIASKRNKEYKNAIEYYNKALELKPSDPWDDYVNRGNAWSELKKYDEAMADYDLALKAKPNYNEAYYNKGIVFEKQKNMEKAIIEFKKAYQFGLRSQLLYERFVAHGLIKKEENRTNESKEDLR
jgi:tetratricopeptide (TPR) repeat protein